MQLRLDAGTKDVSAVRTNDAKLNKEHKQDDEASIKTPVSRCKTI